MDFNEYSQKIYQQNKAVGWWDNPNRCVYTTLQLVSTEVAEATEGDRKDLRDDHLPEREMAEVEIADTAIRMLDIAGRCGWRYNPSKLAPNEHIIKLSPAAAHYALNCQLAKFLPFTADGFDGMKDSLAAEIVYSDLMHQILKVCEFHDYDLQAAMDEKLAYNANRADHKRENRAKAGGKKF